MIIRVEGQSMTAGRHDALYRGHTSGIRYPFVARCLLLPWHKHLSRQRKWMERLPDASRPVLSTKALPCDCSWQPAATFPPSEWPWLSQPRADDVITPLILYTSLPLASPCLETFTNHNTCKLQSFALATQSTPRNHLQHLAGALRETGEYLRIMSAAFWHDWASENWHVRETIKSLIPSLTWVSRDVGNHCVCLCTCIQYPV